MKKLRIIQWYTELGLSHDGTAFSYEFEPATQD